MLRKADFEIAVLLLGYQDRDHVFAMICDTLSCLNLKPWLIIQFGTKTRIVPQSKFGVKVLLSPAVLLFKTQEDSIPLKCFVILFRSVSFLHASICYKIY